MKKLIPLILLILLLTGCAKTYDGATAEQRVCISSDEEYYNDDGSVSYRYRTEYGYDTYGNRTVFLDYVNGELNQKSILRYDESGQLLRELQYDLSGWFPRRTLDARHSYDDSGRRISTEYRRSSERSEITVVYDDQARTRTTTGNGSVTVEYLDENGWVIRSDRTGADGQTSHEEYERRSDGQPLRVLSRSNDTLTETTYTYDDLGRLLRYTITEDGKTILSDSWEYGENMETHFSDGGTTVIYYHADGTKDRREYIDPDGMHYSTTYYTYATIQIPAGEEAAP